MSDLVDDRTKDKLRELIRFVDEHEEDPDADLRAARDTLTDIKERLVPLACEHEPDFESIRYFTGAIFRFDCTKCKAVGTMLVHQRSIEW